MRQLSRYAAKYRVVKVPSLVKVTNLAGTSVCVAPLTGFMEISAKGLNK